MQDRLKTRSRCGEAAVLVAAWLALAAPVAAQQADQGPLHVTVNHAAAITLDAAASVVLVADPEVAEIVNERGNLMFVLGRKPGATNLLVYDGAGKRLVEREIVVVPQNARTVTITRETDQTDYICDPRCAFREHLAGGSRPEIGSAAAAGATPPPASAPPGVGAAPPAFAVPPPPPVGQPARP